MLTSISCCCYCAVRNSFAPILKMIGAVPLLPLYSFMAWTGKNLHFTWFCVLCRLKTKYLNIRCFFLWSWPPFYAQRNDLWDTTSCCHCSNHDSFRGHQFRYSDLLKGRRGGHWDLISLLTFRSERKAGRKHPLADSPQGASLWKRPC